MNKKLIAIVITLVFLIVGFSGCNENDGDVILGGDKFELVTYSVETFDFAPQGNQKLGSGFIHQENSDYYEISGIIKNKAGYLVDILFTMNFYDDNDSLLASKTYTYNDVPNTYEHSFSEIAGTTDDWRTAIANFEQIDKVKFEIREV